MQLSDEEKQRAEDILSNLEVAVGHVFNANRSLGPITKRMGDDLRALRSLLGLVKPH